jgi:hypothetical protein
MSFLIPRRERTSAASSCRFHGYHSSGSPELQKGVLCRTSALALRELLPLAHMHVSVAGASPPRKRHSRGWKRTPKARVRSLSCASDE